MGVHNDSEDEFEEHQTPHQQRGVTLKYEQLRWENVLQEESCLEFTGQDPNDGIRRVINVESINEHTEQTEISIQEFREHG